MVEYHMTMKPVPGFSNYSCSESGRIFSLPRQGTRGGPLTPTEGESRLYVSLCDGGKTIKMGLAAVVLRTWGRLPESGEEACHKDGSFFNNHIDNLYWGSHGENIHDKYRHGTVKRGSDVWNAALNPDSVRWIRENRGKISMNNMARRLGVTYSCAYNAAVGRTWRWVKDE